MQNHKVICNVIVKGFSDNRAIRFHHGNLKVEFIRMPSNEYALVKGKEYLVRCRVGNGFGDAFTDMPKSYIGNLCDVIDLVYGDVGDRAIFFSTLNALLNHLKILNKTLHCIGRDPKKCGFRLAEYILNRFGRVKVAHIGFQPGHVEACSKYFKIYVTDLNPENIGKNKFGIKIMDGELCNEDVLSKVDVACITGSTIINGTLFELIRWCLKYDVKPILYGVSICGAAKILKLEHFCPYSRSKT